MRRKLLFSVIALVVLLATVEVGLRLFDMTRGRGFLDHAPARKDTLLYAPHPFLGITLRPGQRMHSSVGLVTVNEDGFRGRRLPLEKTPGRTRIACLGGSVVFGTSAQDGDTFPERLEVHLGDGYEVLDAGIPGFTSAETLILYALKVSDWRPDVTLLYQAYNDLKAIGPHFVSDYSHFKTSVGDRGVTYDLLKRFKTYRYLREALLLRTPVQSFVQEIGGYEGSTADAEATFHRNVNHIVSLAEGIGSRPVLSTFAMPLGEDALAARPDIRHALAAFIPSLTLEGVRAALARYNDLIRDVAREREVPLFEAAPLLSGDPGNFVDHCHLSPAGAERLGAALAPFVRSLGAPGEASVPAAPAAPPTRGPRAEDAVEVPGAGRDAGEAAVPG